MFKERKSLMIGTAVAAVLSVATPGESKAWGEKTDNIKVVSNQTIYVEGGRNSLGLALERIPQQACEIKQIFPIYKEIKSNVLGGAFIVCEKNTLYPQNILQSAE